MAEMVGERVAVVSYDGLQGNNKNEVREGSVASYQELTGGVRDERRGRDYR
jgi:hypothetical protein